MESPLSGGNSTKRRQVDITTQHPHRGRCEHQPLLFSNQQMILQHAYFAGVCSTYTQLDFQLRAMPGHVNMANFTSNLVWLRDFRHTPATWRLHFAMTTWCLRQHGLLQGLRISCHLDNMGLEFGMERSQHFLMPAPAQGSNCNLLIFNTVSKEDAGYNIAFYNNVLDTRGF